MQPSWTDNKNLKEVTEFERGRTYITGYPGFYGKGSSLVRTFKPYIFQNNMKVAQIRTHDSNKVRMLIPFEPKHSQYKFKIEIDRNGFHVNGSSYHLPEATNNYVIHTQAWGETYIDKSNESTEYMFFKTRTKPKDILETIILDQGGTNDMIGFAGDIATREITVSIEGDDLRLSVKGEGSILVKDQLASKEPVIEWIRLPTGAKYRMARLSDFAQEYGDGSSVACIIQSWAGMTEKSAGCLAPLVFNKSTSPPTSMQAFQLSASSI